MDFQMDHLSGPAGQSFMDNLLQSALDEGVECEENLPFLLTPSPPEAAAVVLVHGFTASPWEMRPLAQKLVGMGFSCLVLRLPGHGVSAEKLALTRMEDWLAEVTHAVAWLRGNHARCYGVGMSTGGLLLLPEAAADQLDGLVLLSPYLRLKHRLAPLAGLLQHFIPYQERPVAERDSAYYTPKRPLSGVHQINRLIRLVQRLLPKILTPTLVLSSSGDQTVSSESARDLFKRLGSQRKNFHLYDERVPHVLTSRDNPLLEDTLQLIGAFLLSLEKP